MPKYAIEDKSGKKLMSFTLYTKELKKLTSSRYDAIFREKGLFDAYLKGLGEQKLSLGEKETIGRVFCAYRLLGFVDYNYEELMNLGLSEILHCAKKIIETAKAVCQKMLSEVEKEYDEGCLKSFRDKAEAYYFLGVSYASNDDEGKAFSYYLSAAEMGHVEAQFCVGECYDNGFGTKMDTDEAYLWFRRAAQQGHERAKFEVEEHEQEKKYLKEIKNQKSSSNDDDDDDDGIIFK